MSELLWMTEADVAQSISIPEAIESIAEVLVRETTGAAGDIPKTMSTWEPKSSAHALGAFDHDAGLVGFKTWINTPQGAAALMTVFDTKSGTASAVLEAGSLGMMRTAAMSGVATRALSAPDATEMTIVGSGRQALSQVRAVCAVRPIERVHVWSPRESSREAMATSVRDNVDVQVFVHDSVSDAVRDVPIVTLVTRASEPFLERGLLAERAHLNAVGAILPKNAEFEPQLLADADLVAVDSIENARRSSREFREFFGDDWSPVHTLGQLLADDTTRPSGARLTVFKGLGMGLSDLAMAILAIEAKEGKL
ncbi:ornithine cyclodeaminase [Rhodococcus sp. CUA-806]|nr:ornithine cyclodeaminase [Rhodococcus sp. CUA-806]